MYLVTESPVFRHSMRSFLHPSARPSFVRRPVNHATRENTYSCNENTMRGAAKSLATPPAAFAMNVKRVIEVVYANIP